MGYIRIEFKDRAMNHIFAADTYDDFLSRVQEFVASILIQAYDKIEQDLIKEYLEKYNKGVN